MPIISTFFGIFIKVYYREHNPPHFHAYYQGFEAVFDIHTGNLLRGKFPKKAQKIVEEWSVDWKEDLLKVWELSQEGKPLFRIPGADQ